MSKRTRDPGNPHKQRDKLPVDAAEASSPPMDSKHAFPVVGIGASAGGLDALEQFFSRMRGRRPWI